MPTAVLFGFLLGIQHALEADHIVAVTTIVSQGRGILRSAVVGMTWGIGHTIIIFAAGFVVLFIKLNIPDTLALSLEFIVGIVLVLLGIPLVRRMVSRQHAHPHEHGDERHRHAHSHDEAPGHDHRHVRKTLLVGMVHGLAGSGAVTLLALGAMDSVPQGLLFLLLFGAGTILGMLVVSSLLGFSLGAAAGLSYGLYRWLQGAVGLGSVAFGIFIMWRVGFVEGLFSLVA